MALLSPAGGGHADRAARLARLENDRDLLARDHPYLKHEIDTRLLVARARGAVPLLLPDGQIDPIEIAIEFHHLYVPRPPAVHDISHRWAPDDDRHIPADHSFCLYLRDIDEPDLTHPEALGLFMLDVVCFLEQQLIYDRIGRFPGTQWPHQRAAYALHVVERLAGERHAARERLWEAARSGGLARNDPCPGGATSKFKRCHIDLVTELARIAARHRLRQHDYADLQRFAGAST